MDEWYIYTQVALFLCLFHFSEKISTHSASSFHSFDCRCIWSCLAHNRLFSNNLFNTYSWCSNIKFSFSGNSLQITFFPLSHYLSLLHILLRYLKYHRIINNCQLSDVFLIFKEILWLYLLLFSYSTTVSEIKDSVHWKCEGRESVGLLL